MLTFDPFSFRGVTINAGDIVSILLVGGEKIIGAAVRMTVRGGLDVICSIADRLTLSSEFLEEEVERIEVLIPFSSAVKQHSGGKREGLHRGEKIDVSLNGSEVSCGVIMAAYKGVIAMQVNSDLHYYGLMKNFLKVA